MYEYLLIDDDSVINFLHKELISIAIPNAIIHEFQSSKQALNWMKQRMQEGTCPKAIIFLDINMPEMNGFDFLDELKLVAGDHFDQGCKIVMVTSSLNEKDRERALSYPYVSNYLEKPLTLEYLSSLS